MEKLVELHKQVKEHIYKLSLEQNKLKSYQNILEKLSNEFYREIIQDSTYKMAHNLIHDFNWAIGNIGRSGKFGNEAFLHLEICLGVIHTYIDTLEVPYFYTYNNTNSRPYFPSELKYVFSKEEGKFYFSLTKEEREKAIRYLDRDEREYILKCSEKLI